MATLQVWIGGPAGGGHQNPRRPACPSSDELNKVIAQLPKPPLPLATVEAPAVPASRWLDAKATPLSIMAPSSA
ncbi:hypothetical protein A5781_07315 [Mycobacterium sp. 852002-30065_SCH5024008]|nr:hypothetical protein A5781_07315 [Mycobacterium sp. 852002-30065_SCH5024008]